MMRGTERALEVDLDHRIPLGLGHVDQHPVAQDAGVVDQHVEASERGDRLIDQALGAFEVRDVVAVGHRITTGRLDLLDHLVGRSRGGGSRSIHLAAEVVHHDLGTVLGQHE